MLDKPVGNWLANCRKSGGLGENQAVARRRAAQMAAIDPDWNPEAPGLGWTVTLDLVAETALAWRADGHGEHMVIVPGVTADGVGLKPGQRERLSGLGGFVWITGRTRGRCLRCGVRPGRWWRSSRSG
ncbi:hypothetical protein ABT217_35165, partial [Streptomyces collinus]